MTEELRETIVAMGRELDLLRTEARHANLLLKALDSLLAVGRDEDPFTGVFEAVLSIFDYSHALALIEADDASDALLESGGVLECVSSSHEGLVGTYWPIGRLLDKVLSGRVLTTISASEDQAWPEQARRLVPPDQSALYLPLRVRERRGLMMLLRDPASGGFDRTHVTLARKFSVLASHAFAASRAHRTEAERHRLKRLTDKLVESQEALTWRANHDQLTGLANRSWIEQLVNERIATVGPGQVLALAFLDIDHFKQVNDYYGHAIGDALLMGVAERLRAEVRLEDLVGRISGDEFVVALGPVTHQAQITGLVERLRERLRQPFDIDGTTLLSSATIGVSVCPDHGSDYETLKRNADMAMYQAKSSSKGGISFYSEALGKVATERMSLERRLRAALDNGQFTYMLQPKVELVEGRVVGFEALAHWIDDTGVIQLPACFLPAASEQGLLDDLTHTIIDQIAADLPRLDKRFDAGARISINISAQQAARPQFMEQLVRRVRGGGLASRLMLELTEEAFVATNLFQARVLPMLREAGIGVSIDDFGTGFSCLSILADITADELKVDRSLIAAIHQRPRNQSILRAIVSLGGALGLEVIAEGIETEAERRYLLDHTSIRLGQGFLFSRPRFVDDLLGVPPSPAAMPAATKAATKAAVPAETRPGIPA